MFHGFHETPFEQLPCIYNSANSNEPVMSHMSKFQTAACITHHIQTFFYIFTVQDLLLFCTFTAWNSQSSSMRYFVIVCVTLMLELLASYTTLMMFNQDNIDLSACNYVSIHIMYKAIPGWCTRCVAMVMLHVYSEQCCSTLHWWDTADAVALRQASTGIWWFKTVG